MSLVANKNDLLPLVNFKQAIEIAEQIQADYYEVSSQSGDGIIELFQKSAMTLLKRIDIVTRPPCNILVLGDPGVGKSNLIHQFLYQKFKGNEYEASNQIETLNRAIEIKQRIVQITIRDAAGLYKFRNEVKAQIPSSDIVYLLFDACDKTSIDNVKFWMNTIVQQTEDRKPIIVIVANKIDGQREVQTEEAQQLVLSFETHCQYAEVSAKSGQGVQDLFLNSISLYCQKNLIDDEQTIPPNKVLIQDALIKIKKAFIELNLDYKEIFNVFDEDKDEILSFDEFKIMIENTTVQLAEKESEALFDAIKERQQISFKEYEFMLQTASDPLIVRTNQQITRRILEYMKVKKVDSTQLFKNFDYSFKSKLSKTDIQKGMNSINVPLTWTELELL